LKKYIISLDGLEFIDATRKGSVARFINHSCEPNCMARKCRISGEVRIGLFALKDITAGTELSCNYNFLGHRGGKIRCQCGAPSCSGFQGMKSLGVKVSSSFYY
jgi:SET domain-containing protein